MLSMMMVGIFAVGAYAVVNGNIPTARADQDRHRAYEAAQAGIEWYAYQLGGDTNYWTGCAWPPVGAMGGHSADSRTGKYYTIPGSDEQFVMELMPAPGLHLLTPTRRPRASRCSTAASCASAHRSPAGTAPDRRDVPAQDFLNYIWFTDRETLPPVRRDAYSGNTEAWAASNCAQVRGAQLDCVSIQFAPQGLRARCTPTTSRARSAARRRSAATRATHRGRRRPRAGDGLKANAGARHANDQGKLVPTRRRSACRRQLVAVERSPTSPTRARPAWTSTATRYRVREATNWGPLTNKMRADTARRRRSRDEDAGATVIWSIHDGVCSGVLRLLPEVQRLLDLRHVASRALQPQQHDRRGARHDRRGNLTRSATA